jgi:hypothetical protein
MGFYKPLSSSALSLTVGNRFALSLTICIQDVQKKPFSPFETLRTAGRDKTRPEAFAVRFAGIYKLRDRLSNLSKAAAGGFVPTRLEC